MSTKLPTQESQTFRFQVRKRTVYNTLMVAVAAFLASTLIGVAATTISTNIVTDGTLAVTGAATTTASLVVGSTNPAGNFGSGDLYVGGDATTTGSLYVGGTASTTTLIVGGRATTTGGLVIGAASQTDNTTTTVTFGSYEATGNDVGTCLKFRQGTGFIWCYIGGTSGTSLVCSTTVSCETP